MGGGKSHSDTVESDSKYENTEGESATSSSSMSLEEETSSSSSGRLRREMRSKKRQDQGKQKGMREEGGSEGHMGQQGRRTKVQRAKGKGEAVGVEVVKKGAEVGVDVVIRRQCTLEAVCALNDELDDGQKHAIREIVWSPVLQYRPFAMDGHLVRALIECWNSETKSFKLGHREVSFSVYDVALITGLPAHGKPVPFQRSEVCGEVEEVLKGAMDDHVSRERGRRRTIQKEVRVYRNYISVLLDLCRVNNTRDRVGVFTKLYAFLVVSGLLFPRCAGGVAWDLISMVEDVESMGEYNWAEATWMFLVQAIEEAKEKMRIAKNVQINGFAMII